MCSPTLSRKTRRVRSRSNLTFFARLAFGRWRCCTRVFVLRLLAGASRVSAESWVCHLKSVFICRMRKFSGELFYRRDTKSAEMDLLLFFSALFVSLRFIGRALWAARSSAFEAEGLVA